MHVALRTQNSKTLPTQKKKEPSQAWTYAARLDSIRATKNDHTQQKIAYVPNGIDNDDTGLIPAWHYVFQKQVDEPRGLILGARDCSRNFSRMLATMPVYVDGYSSLLGGYTAMFGGQVAGWDPDCDWSHLRQDQLRYGIISGIGSRHHFSMDLAMGLQLGFGGLLEKIERSRQDNPTGDMEYYQALAVTIAGIQNWIKRHINKAKALAAVETDPDCRDNLLAIVAQNERLLFAPPQTFHDACQWTAWYQMAARVYNGSGALGRLDQLLYSYYQRDITAGKLTDEEAIFHLACLNVTDPQYIQIGGIKSDGSDATNELSFLILEALHRMKITANVAVAVHRAMDETLLDRAIDIFFEDKLGIPRFCGADSAAEGFARNGFPMELARERAQTGCHWFSVPGREFSVSDVIKINLASVLDVALRELVADANTPNSTAALWERFEVHLRKAVGVTAKGIDFHLKHKYKFFPELVLSLLCHGTIEKGLDASNGGVEFYNICVDGSALATVADSLAAIEICVEKEKRLTWQELIEHLNRNFSGHENIRLMLANVPGFGRGNTVGDAWAEKISKCFTQIVKEKPTPNGVNMIPGLFSWSSTISMGKTLGATPNGRKAAEPISFGANPDPGVDKGGGLTPTALAEAVARVHPGYGNTAPLQLDIDAGAVKGENGRAIFKALIKTHFFLGGSLINTNILDEKTILAACKDPSKYPDLIVRVTGFSAYFASLSDDFRQLVCRRIVKGN